MSIVGMTIRTYIMYMINNQLTVFHDVAYT